MSKIIKIVIIPVVTALLLHCGDLERTNPLDPKNAGSICDEMVLIEAFVNESGGDFINSSVNALERLLREYGTGSFVYLEHHIARNTATDAWALDASLSRYLSLEPSQTDQAIPDVWFNGDATTRVQGASDPETAYQRYKPVLEAELGRQCRYTIELEANMRNGRIEASANIAKLGNKDANDLTVALAVLERLTSVRKIVRAWETVRVIGELEGGEMTSVQHNIDIPNNWDDSKLEVVIMIHNSVNFQVYQCESVTL